MATYVIVHGAYGGAWSWNRLVTPLPRQAGHTVFAATLTGLGERDHLAPPEVGLSLHIEDVVNLLVHEDLSEGLLVGHSHGGMVITGVADRVPERLAQLVYLDAAMPADGQAVVDRFGPERGQDLSSVRTARATAGGCHQARCRPTIQPTSWPGPARAGPRSRSRPLPSRSD
jgi:pimeloyl-ACP methyl ester carboxylesterase